MQETNGTDTEQRLSIDQAIQLAMALQKQNKLDQAEGIYAEILSVAPHHPDALHFSGVLQYQRGRNDRAVQLINRALEVSPDYMDAHNNLGNIHMEEGQLEAAEAAYRRTVELAPEHVGARNNLATLLRARERFEESETLFRETIEKYSDFYPLHYNLGYLLYQQDRVDEAVEHLFKAVVLDPSQATSKVLLGIILVKLGRRDEAIEMYREWLVKEPDDPEAQYLLAAISGEGVPDRAPEDYIQKLFDRFAASFEERLSRLGYNAPHLVAEALSTAVGEPAGGLRILDAGCGTGLCGPLLKPHARHLEGVDLSGGMLQRADRTGKYDRLTQAELTVYFRDHPSGYDVITSADTLCYFGDLKAVFAAAVTALKPGGRFIFTVELADAKAVENNGGYHILPQGRFAHTEDYLRRTARKAGMRIDAVVQAVLRQELGKPVQGLVATLLSV